MNREIKFRVWNSRVKRFLHPQDLCFLPEDDNTLEPRIMLSYGELGDVYKPQVQQYIGFKDKNNKEIYEGDILKLAIPSFKMDYLYVIDYYGGSFMNPYAYRRMGEGRTAEVVGRVSFQTIDINKLEIIGNIFENPELIKTEI